MARARAVTALAAAAALAAVFGVGASGPWWPDEELCSGFAPFKRECKQDSECAWLPGYGCMTAPDACAAVPEGKGRRKRCEAVPSTTCACSRSRGKCGLCRPAAAPSPAPTPGPLPDPPAYEKIPKPLTPLCSSVSAPAVNDPLFNGVGFGSDVLIEEVVQAYCDILPDCFVNKKPSTPWACESAMDICRSITDATVCDSNELCAFGDNNCLPKKLTWSPLDVAANWLNAVNNGVAACRDVANLFVDDTNARKAPPLLLGTVGSPDVNPYAGYDVGRSDITTYFCESFLTSAPSAFVCGVTKFDGVCADALKPYGGSPGPLSRGLPMYSVTLDQEFDAGRIVIGEERLGAPYGGATMSGNWGFTYQAGPNAGKTRLARFTFVIAENGYIQTLHSDFV